MTIEVSDAITVKCPSLPNDFQDLSAGIITSVVKDFLKGMDYNTPNIWSHNEKIEEAMRAEMYARKIQCPILERSLHTAASLAELGYHECTLAEKINIALITWYLIYVDDISIEHNEMASVFIHNFLRGQTQPDPVFNALAELLLTSFDYYETLIATDITNSIFAFTASNVVESQVTHRKLIIPHGAIRFAWFLRDRTGAGIAYSLFPFTKTLGVDFTDFMTALPDMCFWICACNDLLSFRKEALSGEKGTYIENRALVEGKDPLQVATEIERELQVSRNTIFATIAHNPAAVKAWRVFELGYVAWHLEQDRYMLQDFVLLKYS